MLKKMGWKEGEGIGKNLQGNASHVVVKRRVQNMGLGGETVSNDVAYKASAQGFAAILGNLNKKYSSSSSKSGSKRKAKDTHRFLSTSQNLNGNGLTLWL